MKSKSYSVRSMVETLEGRRMFSAAPAGDVSTVPFIGPMEAQEYAASQARVKAVPVASAAPTLQDAQIPTPKTLIFWAKPQSASSLGGWLRSGSDD